jgi:peptidoglycan hydrolase-like protein with peptidoglycan-binding domain
MASLKKDIQFPDERDKSLSTLLLLLFGGILLSVGSLALIGYFVGKAKKSDGETVGSQKTGTFKCLSNNYPLQFGTCHPDVKVLQQYLKKMGANIGSFGKNKDGIDGEFGTMTQMASSKYLNKETFNSMEIQAMRKQL